MSRVLHLTRNPLPDQNKFTDLSSSPHTRPPQSPPQLSQVVLVLAKQERVPVQVVATRPLALPHLEPLTLHLQLLLHPLPHPQPLILMLHPVPPQHPHGSSPLLSQPHNPYHLRHPQCHPPLHSSSHLNLACPHMVLLLLLLNQQLAFLVKRHHNNSHILQTSHPLLTCPNHMGDSVLHRPRILVPALGGQENLMEVLDQQDVHFQLRWSMALIQDMVLCHHLLEVQEALHWAMVVQDIHLP